MNIARSASLIGALLATGLMSGLYLTFSIAVMPGISRTGDKTFVESMRAMNIAILNGWFAIIFGGPLVIGAIALLTRLGEDDRTALVWVAIAVALYVVTLIVTFAINIPLNNQLEETVDIAKARKLFEQKWIQWNAVRTVISIASFAALAIAWRTGA